MTVETGTTPQRPLITRPLALFLLASVGTSISYQLLLSVIPLYATSGGATRTGAGLTTGTMMAATVAAELVMPRLLARFGYRALYATGPLLLGLPVLLLLTSSGMTTILAVCVIRGLGFAVTVVLGSALVATLAPPERRGEALGLYGAVGILSIVVLPLGVWLATRIGYPPVFVTGAVAALCAFIAVPSLPGRIPATEPALGVLTALRTPALIRPSVVFSATAVASGVIVTFLPLAVTRASGTVAMLGLLVQAVMATASRWVAGRYCDRYGPQRLIIPGLLAAAGGLLTLAATGSTLLVLLGSAVFGAGFGVSKTASLVMLFNRVSPGGYGTASTMWNLSYDLGTGAGAIGFGVLAARAGYPEAFALTAALMLVALVPAVLDRRTTVSTGGEPR